MKLPVLRAVGATFAFTLQHWLDVARIVWLPLVLFMAFSAWIGPTYMGTVLEMSSMGSDPSPEDALRVIGAVLPLMFLMLIASVYFYLVVFAGLLKLVTRGEKPTLPFYLGFGADEWRLLGTWVLLILLFIGIQIALTIAGAIAGAIGGVVASAVPLFGMIVAVVGVCAAVTVFIWINLRLSLATPAAIGAHKIGLGPSWSASKGNVWRLLGYWLIWGVLFLIGEILLIAILMPQYFEFLASAFSGDPYQIQAASNAMMEQAFSMYDLSSPITLVRLAIGFVASGAAITIWALASGVAWRMMTDDAPESPAGP